ncbi:MAG: DUF72 domain-containing protein [Phycisphaerae bacterium]|nr:DUF72 domain-containing protein [Phycisphaerae bacterium]
MSGKAHIGTSGFSYGHWKGVFYGDDVPQRQWLEYYAEHFDTVELNNTFYSMPREKTCRSWRQRTPEGFCFAVKLNRLITHRKRLADCGELLGAYLKAVDHLGEKLGPVLVQLPPRFGADPSRLDVFLEICPTDHRWAVEFRDPSWLCEEVYAVLRARNAALVVHDLIKDHPREVTADFMYLRFHGPSRRYAGCYTRQALAAAAKRIREHLAAGLDVCAYFNNDIAGHAVRNAADLKRYVTARP